MSPPTQPAAYPFGTVRVMSQTRGRGRGRHVERCAAGGTMFLEGPGGHSNVEVWMEETKTTSRTSGTRSRARRGGGDGDALGTARESTTQSTLSASASSGIAGKVRERATAQLNTQKDRATDGLGLIAQAVRQTTGKLREDQQDTIAQYVEKAADQIERLSNSLREKDVSELLQDAQRFARRQPALFIGGSFAAGLLAARFLKSSTDERRSSDYDVRQTNEYGSPTGFDDPSRGAY